ncbi:MAG: hypothetical protein L0154_16220 [Chloroflexi bacterium]|nr:hypothetical protein [Chloroflexota bacterium]
MNSLSLDDLDTLDVALKVCNRYAVNPLSSDASEAFFNKLLQDYDGDKNNKAQLRRYIKKHVSESFVALNKRPEWIQGAEWPFFEGEPMIFVGQVDISVSEDNPARLMFHDDTTFYLFINTSGVMVTEVIMQQF